jgi:hypothetical protein
MSERRPRFGYGILFSLMGRPDKGSRSLWCDLLMIHRLVAAAFGRLNKSCLKTATWDATLLRFGKKIPMHGVIHDAG